MEREFILSWQFERQLKYFSNEKDILIDIEQEIFRDLEKEIAARDIIQGTGGFTKIRVPFDGRGKSSSLRVIYLDSAIDEKVFLMMIYSKSEFENISEQARKVLKQIALEIKNEKKERNS